MLIEVNPRDFDRVSIQSAKQKARQSLREIQKDTLYSEFKDREGELIVGYYQRERNGTISWIWAVPKVSCRGAISPRAKSIEPTTGSGP